MYMYKYVVHSANAHIQRSYLIHNINQFNLYISARAREATLIVIIVVVVVTVDGRPTLHSVTSITEEIDVLFSITKLKCVPMTGVKARSSVVVCKHLQQQ